MAAPARAQTAGLILAGGEGRRMGGRDKGLVDYAGRPLVAHVAERFAPQVGHLLISANRHVEAYAAYAATVVRDAVPVNRASDGPAVYLGPLAGILAGLRAAPLPWLAVVPCDLPQLPPDVVSRLADGLGDAEIAHATTPAGPEPAVCLIATALADDLARALDAGTRSLRAWYATRRTRTVAFPSAEPFRNCNTPEDLL